MQLVRQRMPATILILGLSNKETIEFQSKIRVKIFPFRVVSLLETNNHLQNIKIAGDCFRITSSDNWRDAVFVFVRAVPIVIVYTHNDIDHPADDTFVREEVMYILENNYKYKTIFVTPSENSSYLKKMFEDAEYNSKDALFIESQEKCYDLIKYMLNSRGVVPNVNRPVNKINAEYIAFNYETKRVEDRTDI